mmetsp:Transcript_3963/g.9356  ORF Transcript_3963/g.9356 Transcript_3963/m.9356 type:complete len:217 (-) Transcript_3963:1167-1817(-)
MGAKSSAQNQEEQYQKKAPPGQGATPGLHTISPGIQQTLWTRPTTSKLTRNFSNMPPEGNKSIRRKSSARKRKKSWTGRSLRSRRRNRRRKRRGTRTRRKRARKPPPAAALAHHHHHPRPATPTKHWEQTLRVRNPPNGTIGVTSTGLHLHAACVQRAPWPRPEKEPGGVEQAASISRPSRRISPRKWETPTSSPRRTVPNLPRARVQRDICIPRS